MFGKLEVFEESWKEIQANFVYESNKFIYFRAENDAWLTVGVLRLEDCTMLH